MNHQIGNWHEATLDILFRNLPEKRSSRWGETTTAEKMSECRWVKPKLVCQVAFLEWTDAGHLRYCTFVCMRDDKKPAEVIRETRLPGVTPEGTSVPTYAEPPLGRIVQRAIARNP